VFSTLAEFGLVQVLMEPIAPFRVVSVTPGWEKLCGFDNACIAGGTLSVLQGPLTDPAAVARLVDAARHLRRATVRLINYNAKGEAFEHDAFVDVLKDPCGTVRYLQTTSLVLQPPGCALTKPSPLQTPRLAHLMLLSAIPVG